MPHALILDIAAGAWQITPDTLTLDFVPLPEAGTSAAAGRMPLADDSFDWVFCAGTQERAQDLWRAMGEVHRILKPGGLVCVSVSLTPDASRKPAEHGRSAAERLGRLWQRFDEIDSSLRSGPAGGLTWFAREWADHCCTNRYVLRLFLVLSVFASAPIRYLCNFLGRQRSVSALYYRGRKPLVEDRDSPGEHAS